MKSHRIQVTTNSAGQPNLTERLDREPSPRRRADLIKHLAELGAMLESIGLTNILGSATCRSGGANMRIVLSSESKPIGDLGDEFFINALADYMPGSSRTSEKEPS
ncbi:UNVERIFIED_ORG: hypothetical protein ABIC54_000777 [Burkholderia sp. 1263]|uniref:hypothetical protein n=1 Tax=Paraburkholderia terricola TaxID=169427 RepID=UPI0028624EF6|nr:hypothetical protein [Paraburkholderia terricola]MDR6450300.1 hypothetical protein [Paraburkholderia terricola]